MSIGLSWLRTTQKSCWGGCSLGANEYGIAQWFHDYFSSIEYCLVYLSVLRPLMLCKWIIMIIWPWQALSFVLWPLAVWPPSQFSLDDHVIAGFLFDYSEFWTLLSENSKVSHIFFGRPWHSTRWCLVPLLCKTVFFLARNQSVG